MRQLVFAVAFFLMLQCTACNWCEQPVFMEHRRPAKVPSDAVLVQLAKGGVWQRCEVASTTGKIRCQIFNWKGGLLYDEIFLPYDPGPALRASDLKIPPYVPAVGPDWVCLQNGRILLPTSRFEQLKSFLDKTKPKDGTR